MIFKRVIDKGFEKNNNINEKILNLNNNNDTFSQQMYNEIIKYKGGEEVMKELFDKSVQF